MSKYLPIRDAEALSRVMSLLQKQDPAIYIMATFVSETGAYLVDVVNSTSDAYTHSPTYINNRNKIEYRMDDAFYAYILQYIAKLPRDTIYLFPQSRNTNRPMRVEAASKRILELTTSFGTPMSFMSFQKTFAFRYLCKHGNLVGTHLGGVGHGKTAICSYLGLTDDEYFSFISGTVMDVPAIADLYKKSSAEIYIALDCCEKYIDLHSYDFDFEKKAYAFLNGIKQCTNDFLGNL